MSKTRVAFGKADSADIYYRVGWKSDTEVLYVEQGRKKRVYVPGFEYLRAKEDISGVRVELFEDAKDILGSLKGPVLVSGRFPQGLAKHIGSVKTTNELYPQRRKKTKEEIKHLAKAQKVAREIIEIIRKYVNRRGSSIKRGRLYYRGKPVRVQELRVLARSELIKRGYDCPDIILSTGPQTAQPHNRGSGIVRQGPLVIDCFPQSTETLYHGDMTRTIIVGEDKQAEKLIKAVTEVCKLCIKKCVPGMSCSELHAYAQEELAKRGFETNSEHGFIHALGHGVGLDIHEFPSISPRSEDKLLKDMVVTIEPGLYYDIGARYEEMVVVGKNPRVL